MQSLDVRSLHYSVREADSKKNLVKKLVTCDTVGGEETWRTVLDGVSLTVESGEIMAIMGNSGSGKTSLLDVIAGRHEQSKAVRTTGDVLIDGEPPSTDVLHSAVAYVRQDDRLIAQLTVRETLEFVAALKLPASMAWSEKAACVENVIQELALWHVVDQPVGSVEKRGISGGERRRVSIGVQMMLNPQLLLLDEPTSGLDAFTAVQLVDLLHQLARSGRLVLLTVHQPRAAIFHKFDKLLLLSAGGRTVYCGESKTKVLDYFGSVGYPCPKLSNPADYLVDIATVDLHTAEQEASSQQRVDELVELFEQRRTGRSAIMWTGPPAAESSEVKPPTETTASMESTPLTGSTQATNLRVLPSGKGPGLFGQFLVLCWRTWLKEFRSYGWQIQQMVAAIWISIELGIIYYHLGLDQRGVRDRISLVYSSMALYPFMVTLDTVAKLHSERRFFYYEIQDGMYGSLPLFFSKLMCELPFNILAFLCFAPIFYWMADLNNDPYVFLQSAAFVLLVVYVSRSSALAIASAFHHFQVAQFIANLMFTVNVFASGFILNLTSINPAVRWLNNVAYVRWAIQGMASLQFRNVTFACDDIDPSFNSTCVRTGDAALQFYALNEYDDTDSWLILAGMFVVWNALALIGLKLRSQRPEQM